MKKYIYCGTCAIIVRNTISDQLDTKLDLIEEIENETDQYLT